MIVLDENLPGSDAYARLFETTGWNDGYRADPSELSRGIAESWYTVSAYDGDELVGFGRVISDGVLYAFICDMIVAPEHQGHGIGSRILEAMLARCREAGLRVVWLMCAKGKTGFYEGHGFSPRPGDGPGMQLSLGDRS